MARYYILSLSEKYGGGEVYISNFCYLLEADVDICVISPRVDELKRKVLKGGANFIEIKGGGFFEIRFRLLLIIIKLIIENKKKNKNKKEKEKEYFLMNGRAASYIFPFLLNIFGLDVISIAHTNINPSGGIKDLIYGFSLKFCKSIVAVSDTTRLTILSRWGELKVVSIPNWVYRSNIVFSKSRNIYPKFVLVSRLVEEKGILDAVKAFNFFENIELHIYGDGPLKSKLVDIAANSKNKWLKIHGFSENIRSEIAKYDLMVCPSYDESFSYSTAEGIMEGLLCVASEIPAHRELLGNYYPNDLFFKKGSIEDQIRAISVAIEYFSSPKREKYFEAIAIARERITSRNSPDLAKVAYRKLIEEYK